jgi:hypothetical protein
MDLQKLFNNFIQLGFKVRSLGLDGLESWKDASASLENDTEIAKWAESRLKTDGYANIVGKDAIYDYVYNDLGIKGEEIPDKATNPNFEAHHFLLQLVRLVKNDKCTQKKIAQVAYNIGQFMATVGSGVYSSDALSFYHANNLGRLESYIILESELYGGYKPNTPVNIYDSFLNMTPHKILNNTCPGCKLNTKCKTCGTEYINILV